MQFITKILLSILDHIRLYLKTELDKIRPITTNILLRENKGFDFASWRDQLKLIGKDGLKDYDQVIIANSTFYGPLYPLKELFDNIAKQDFDFWAPTKYTNYIGIPDHVQPYFLIVNKTLHQDNIFWQFWDYVKDDYDNLWDVVWQCEIFLTQFLVKNGFKYAVGSEIKDNSVLVKLNYIEPYVINAPSFLIETESLAFIKVKAFQQAHTITYKQSRQIFNSIRRMGYTFPTHLITNHQRRVSSLSHLKMLPDTFLNNDAYKEENEKELSAQKIGVFVHLFYEDNIAMLYRYLSKIPYKFDLNITTPKETIAKNVRDISHKNLPLLNSLDVRIVENHGRDFAPWDFSI